MGYQPQQTELDPEEEHHLSQEADSSGAAPSSGPVGTGSALVGRTLQGRYRFDALGGEGSFARVFRVHDLYRRVDLAAKVLRSDIAQEPAFLERFRREAQVLSRLQHPNIVRYYDTIELENVVFIMHDFIEGQTLQNVLRKRTQPITPFESLDYLTPLAAALHYAHQEGIIHRDLKPANILIDQSGNLFVTDFGIARILTDTSTLTMDMSVGTPHYMSPEQILAGEVTAATDIYALGVMLYQMYTGRLPFTGDSAAAQGNTTAVRIAFEHLHVRPAPLTEINPRVSLAVESVVMRCLEKDPEQRFESVSALYDALTDAIGMPSVALDARQIPQPKSEAVEPPPSIVPPQMPDQRSYNGIPLATDFDVADVPEGIPALDWEDKPKRGQKAKREYKSEWKVYRDAAHEARRDAREMRREMREQRWADSEKAREKESEMEEKDREKGTEKESEKEPEKGGFSAELAPSDRLSQFTMGGIVLWSGVVLMLNTMAATSGMFDKPWAWIMGGAGALLLVEVAARLTLPEFRARPGARLVTGLVLLAVGLGVGISIGTLWPLILIAVGLGLLLNHLSE